MQEIIEKYGSNIAILDVRSKFSAGENLNDLVSQLWVQNKIDRYLYMLKKNSDLVYNSTNRSKNLVKFLGLEGEIIIHEKFEARPASDIIENGEIFSKSKSQILDLGLQLMNATQGLHGEVYQEGIVHLDINPTNILIDNDNNLKLMDFNIAQDKKRIEIPDFAQFLYGTEKFAAPEAFIMVNKSLRLGEQTDIYGVGVTLAALLCGTLEVIEKDNLFENKGSCLKSEVLQMIGQNYSRELASFVEKSTQYIPEDRFLNINEMKRNFELILL